ncbi:DMT family transporter [Hydrogenophaga sp. OTU3427]|uniref:DMT family transporter n=1 Tax=Hydrogenophaga sp. OTU3427 TaxID=3043856 RepID=UPI00313F2013
MTFSFRRPSPRVLGVGSALVTVLMWTAFIVVARASAHRTLTPFDIAFMRFVGAGVVLLPVGWWMVRRAADRGQTWLGLSPLSARLTVTVGLLAGVGYSCLAYSGFYFAPATHASVLMPGTLPLFTTLVAAWVLRDRITPARAAGLALILGGDLLVGGASLLQAFAGGTVWMGDLMFMSAAFCWAIYTVIARRHGLAAVPATVAVSVFALLSFVPLYVALAASGVVTSHLLQAPWQELLFQAAFQGGGSVVISGITFTQMVRYFGPVRSTMLTAMVPGLSAMGAVLLLGEPLHWNLVVGLALVTGGILFGVRAAAQRA